MEEENTYLDDSEVNRDPVPPPKLPGDAPIPHPVHPGEPSLLELLRNDLQVLAFDGVGGLQGHVLAFHVPKKKKAVGLFEAGADFPEIQQCR